MIIMKDDSISRQAAIDAMDEALTRVFVEHRDIAEKVINKISSAQPEIVRCKECKHWLPHYQLGYDEDNNEYHDYCKRLIPEEDEYYAFYRNADDFCSRAERRNDDVV